MKPDISVRLAAAAVASVFLLTACRPVLEVKPTKPEPPAPEYEVQYSYLNPDGSESLVPTDIRVYSTTKDGVRQPGYALVQLALPGVYSIMFTDDVSDPNADFLQLFFISGAGLPLRIVNRFTLVGEDGSKTQKTVVGVPSEYDETTQTFDVAFSSVDDPSDTMVLQGVVLNKKLLEAKEGFNQYRHNFDEYINYLLVGGTAVAYALQQRAQAGDAWAGAAGQAAPLPSPVPSSSRFVLGNIRNSVARAFCNLVSVVAFAVATAVSKVATVINAPVLHVVAAVTYFVGVVATVIAEALEPEPYYSIGSSGGGAQMDPPVVFIWEVDEHGSPAEVPTDHALYFDNDGTIHLHVRDDVNTKKYFKVETSLGAFDVMTVQQNSASQTFKHEVNAYAATDSGLGSSIFDKNKRMVPFHREFYLEVSRTTAIYDAHKSASYIFLSFPELSAIMQLNGQKAELETELENATGADVKQKCHNSFKINICESQTFCQSPAAP